MKATKKGEFAMRGVFVLFIGLALALCHAQTPVKPDQTQTKKQAPAKKQGKSAKKDQTKTKSRSAADQSAVPGQEFPKPPEKVEPRGPRTPPVAPANPNSPDPTKPTTTKPIK
jgi:hypothetical protein